MRAPRVRLADVVRFSWVDGPGNRFVAFLQGCNFDCLACHNPQTIPLESVHAREVTVEELVGEVRACLPYVSGVTVSGGEATLQADFVGAFFAALKADPQTGHLSTMIDSNGSADEGTWTELAPVTDGVMVDLKALDDDLHRRLTGQPNAAVLHSIRYLARLGRLHEVRLLLVPGVNDADSALRATAEWLLDVDPDVRVRLNRFLAHGVRAKARDWPEATAADLDRWRAVLTEAGITRLTASGLGLAPASG